MIRIKELRMARGQSQMELARALGVKQNTVSNWENGNRLLDAETIGRLSDFFDVPADYLLGRTPSPLSGRGVPVPVLGYIPAGTPIEAVEEILDYEEIDPHTAAQGEYFALKLRGSSMEPRMCDGDVVIVRKQPDVESGDIAVVLSGGSNATVKRIKKEQAGMMLIPNNPAYEPVFYSRRDIETLPVQILGKVTELRAHL